MVIPGLDREDSTVALSATKEYIISHYCPKVTITNQKDKRRKVTFQKRTSDLKTDEFTVMVNKVIKDFPFIPLPDNGEISSLIAYYEAIY